MTAWIAIVSVIDRVVIQLGVVNWVWQIHFPLLGIRWMNTVSFPEKCASYTHIEKANAFQQFPAETLHWANTCKLYYNLLGFNK